MNRRQVGAEYETVAENYLKQQGYQIVEKNFRNLIGEIDIIARDGEYLVFVEVKYRANTSFGSPLEAVDYRKQRTIIKVAQYYLLHQGYGMQQNCRFDVIAILGGEVTLIKNAFEV